MKLYLVRHGDACPGSADTDRVLTEKGLREVASLAGSLKDRAVHVAKLWHSPRVRAVQSAQRIAKEIGALAVSEARDGLAPDDDVNRWVPGLEGEAGDLMIVGHLPFLKRLASILLTRTLDFEVPGFTTAGAVCLERRRPGEWRFVWAIEPEGLRPNGPKGPEGAPKSPAS